MQDVLLLQLGEKTDLKPHECKVWTVPGAEHVTALVHFSAAHTICSKTSGSLSSTESCPESSFFRLVLSHCTQNGLMQDGSRCACVLCRLQMQQAILD